MKRFLGDPLVQYFLALVLGALAGFGVEAGLGNVVAYQRPHGARGYTIRAEAGWHRYLPLGCCLGGLLVVKGLRSQNR